MNCCAVAFKFLQAQRQGDLMSLRMAHPYAPCVGAHLVEPKLEEALMAQRYALTEVAT